MSSDRRRRLLRAAGMVLMAPVALAQRKSIRPHRIGILGAGSPPTLQQELLGLGYVEGRDVVFEIRNPEGRSDRLDALAMELVRVNVAVIVAANPASVLAARRATTTIPIVMMHTPDPVQLGLVSSLARPGGNVTGVTTLSAELSIKQLALLREAIPQAARVALLWNSQNPWHPATVKAIQDGSGPLGFQLQALDVRSRDALEGAFRAMTVARMQAVLVLADPMTFFHRRELADLALQHRLPMMGSLREYAEAGGLMSYWADTADVYRRAASYVDRILRGARPGDLPIEQPTKFELVVNLKTARSLGIAVPRSVLLRADRVIE